MINNETHTRFWVTLQRQYYDLLFNDAQEHNLSTSAYARQILSEYIEKNHPDIAISNAVSNSLESLNKTIIDSLEKKDYGDPFTVKDLFAEQEWETMTRSEKGIAAKILAAISRNSDTNSVPYRLKIVDKRNKTSIYEKERSIL